MDGLNTVDALAHLLPTSGIGVLCSFPISLRDACVNLVGAQSCFGHYGSVDFGAVFISVAPLVQNGFRSVLGNDDLFLRSRPEIIEAQVSVGGARPFLPSPCPRCCFQNHPALVVVLIAGVASVGLDFQ